MRYCGHEKNLNFKKHSSYYSDQKRFELGDENVPLLKKVILSEQSVKVRNF